MKNIVFIVLGIFLSIPSVYALDVSVVDSRAQVGATINSLQAKVDALDGAITIHADSITEHAVSITTNIVDISTNVTGIGTNVTSIGNVDAKVTSIRTCGNAGKVQKTDGSCIPPAAVTADTLFTNLGCTNGQVIWKHPTTGVVGCVNAKDAAFNELACANGEFIRKHPTTGVSECVVNPMYSCSCVAAIYNHVDISIVLPNTNVCTFVKRETDNSCGYVTVAYICTAGGWQFMDHTSFFGC